ncbi:hypothetical protein N658DRAFT_516673 [Parathielavia hyrcaniae]|uniref:Uncharacterized protein n=1 Tax=Parathielavia hyrcaniae TaxID=113614 RepID=A0AAN6PYM6_9PEZI|nr:hypothetical protein N658DRAFT_516673 [Parathielavia hyrcaniae]
MAGPRAPIGTLSQHAAAAAGLVRNMVPKVFTSSDAKRTRKTDEPVESDSDSDSDTDSDNSETDASVKEDTKDWASKINAKKAASTPIKAEPAPVSSPKTKMTSPPVESNIKKSESPESSASESENDSGSEDEDDKMDVDSKSDVKRAVKEDSPDSDAGSESSDEEMADPETDKKAPSASASEADSDSGSDSSDDESVSGTSGAKVTTTAAAATKEVSASDDESASESESEGEEQLPAKSKTTAQSESDSEGEGESSSDSEDESEPPRNTKQKAPAAASKPVKEVASAEKSAPVKPSKQSVPVNGTAKSKAKSSEFVSDSDSSDAAESSGSDSEEESAAQSLTVEKQKGKTPSRPPPRDIASQGFTLRKAGDDVDAVAVARAFKKAKAEGKQIWYFTTPKSVPIEVVQKHAIPMEKVHSGKPIFTHEGADYAGHFEESGYHAIKVLIPGKNGSTYGTMSHSVDRVFHITRVTLRGDEGESEPAPAPTLSALVNAPRPQPKGLKSRYQPFGVTNGVTGSSGAAHPSDNDEDVEMAQAPPLLNDSAADAKSDTPKKAAKKRKLADVEKGTPNHEEVASTPAKKPKKARVDKKEAEPSPAKPIKQTPIAPPPVPPSFAKTAAQPSPIKKSKGKDKSKKKDSASAEKASDVKKPTKVTPVLPPTFPTMKST